MKYFEKEAVLGSFARTIGTLSAKAIKGTAGAQKFADKFDRADVSIQMALRKPIGSVYQVLDKPLNAIEKTRPAQFVEKRFATPAKNKLVGIKNKIFGSPRPTRTDIPVATPERGFFDGLIKKNMRTPLIGLPATIADAPIISHALSVPEAAMLHHFGSPPAVTGAYLGAANIPGLPSKSWTIGRAANAIDLGLRNFTARTTGIKNRSYDAMDVIVESENKMKQIAKKRIVATPQEKSDFSRSNYIRKELLKSDKYRP